MTKETITVNIDKNLLLQARNGMNMSIDDFIEYSLTMYFKHEDRYAKLFYEGAKIYSRLKTIQDTMTAIDNKSKDNQNGSYEQAMETITRIHDSVGHIGKDKIRKIAVANNISPTDLIEYVSSLGDFEVTNYTGIPS